jgi:hypothetical protein
MGLDITAYSKLKLLDTKRLKDGTVVDAQTGAEVEDYCYVYKPEGFKDRAASLQDEGHYGYDQTLCFSAGSYSGYNEWRNELAALAGYAPIQVTNERGMLELRYDESVWELSEGPFWELINYSDCQGTLDSVEAAKLVKDFKAFLPQAEAKDRHFYDKYVRWLNAFEFASDDGAVRFH